MNEEEQEELQEFEQDIQEHLEQIIQKIEELDSEHSQTHAIESTVGHLGMGLLAQKGVCNTGVSAGIQNASYVISQAYASSMIAQLPLEINHNNNNNNLKKDLGYIG